jgi:type IV pilus assembly protein PilY1
VTSKASLATSQASFGQTLDVTPPMSTYWMSRTWYYSLKVFEDSGVRNIFDSPSAAATFDTNRIVFYDYVQSVGPPVSAAAAAWTWDFRSLVLIDGSNNNPTTLADATSPGWAIYYNHGPQVTASDHVYNVNVLDERTSSVSGLYGKVLWNTIQTTQGEATSAKAGCVQSKCQGAFYRVSYHYGADAITGGPVFQDSSGNPQRSVAQNTLVPAQGDQPTVFVNQAGQIAVGLTAVNPEKGASNLGMSTAMDPVMGLGVVEVSRDLHNCRHSSSAVGATPPDPSKCN